MLALVGSNDADLDRETRRELAISHATDDLYDVDPPLALTLTIGLPPARAMLARYVAWKKKISDELADLQAQRARLQGFIDAPGETTATIKSAIRRTADWLLGKGDDNSDGKSRRALDEKLAMETHRADAAREALPELELKLDVAARRMEALEGREGEFLKPAIAEVAEEARLPERFLQKAAELEEIASLIYGHAQALGLAPRAVNFPKLPLLERVENSDLTIPRKADAETWRVISNALLADPKFDAAKFLPR